MAQQQAQVSYCSNSCPYHPSHTSVQVDEVIGIMHKNVENVLERDRKLGDLEERADALQDGCAQFEKQVSLSSIFLLSCRTVCKRSDQG